VRFVAVGDVMIDIVCSETPPRGSRVHAGVSMRAGGSAVNAANYAAAAGADACVVGRIGNDPAGDLMRTTLAAKGIEAQLAQDPDLPTGAVVALRGDESVSVIADRGANARLSLADVPDPLEGDAVLVSGFALFQSGSAQAARAALERFAGAWAAVDLATPGLAAAADLDDLARDANVLFATADEAKAVTGAAADEAARALASRFAIVCVKLGEAGALVAQGDRVERYEATPVVRGSPFGAGDAFAAAFLVSLARGDGLGQTLEVACAAGAQAAQSG
jgi:sugar/nucleoside kinase (ribokinase family)